MNWKSVRNTRNVIIAIGYDQEGDTLNSKGRPVNGGGEFVRFVSGWGQTRAVVCLAGGPGSEGWVWMLCGAPGEQDKTRMDGETFWRQKNKILH